MRQGNIHILSTRTLDEAMVSKAADANICIYSTAFIYTEPLLSDELTVQLQQLSTQSLNAVFTSANAVTAVAEQINKPANWKIWCTGGKTKEFAISAFGEESILSFSKNASGLAERIIASGQVIKATFFCGDQHLTDLPEKLKSNGILIYEVIVYTTVQTPQFIEKNYDGILFFSPSAVHSFFSMNTVATDVTLFSIGSTTTSAIKSYCTNRVITSEWPGTDTLLELVTDFYNKTSYSE